MAKGQAWTYHCGQWIEGNPRLVGPLTHALWLSSIVFDGARAFEGVTPDLDQHCARVIDSARNLGLAPPLTAGEVFEIALEGVHRFRRGTELYIRPMFFAEDGWVDPDPESTQFVATVYEVPMPPATGSTACLSSRRRPSPEVAPTSAKASCLYPQSGLALQEAKRRGFQNAVMLDQIGNVSEFATANIFIAKDGVVATPVPNGTFLDGITRRRVIKLLREDGVDVQERAVAPAEVLEADEVFSTGNYGKVMSFSRIEDRDLQPGPCFNKARKLYWDYAHAA